MTYRDDFEDDWDDDADAPDEYGVDDDDAEEPVVPCPYCRKEIYEDAPRCPFCGAYVSAEDRPAGRQPWWILLGVLAVMYAVYRWTVG